MKNVCVYALQLSAADPEHRSSISGRLEHVLSGRRHEFKDGEGLLACLAQEQSLVCDAIFLAAQRPQA